VTDANIKVNAEEELEAAEEALAAATGCLERGQLRSAVSRAYFATFHAARALIFTKGLEPRTHRGARHLLNVHFVRTGELDSSFDRLLAHAEKDREDADYAPFATFTAEDAIARIEGAQQLLAEARRRVESL
jgi:hypothetical protein